MRVALAQMHIIPGALEQNFSTMLAMIVEAKAQSADLIAFPEMCLSGYLLSDQWLDRSFCAELMAYNEKVRLASDGIAIAFGSAFVDDHINERLEDNHPHPNKDGRTRMYNAVIIVQNGEYAKRAANTDLLPEGVQPKTLLPNYRFFDDERYFFSLQSVSQDHGMPLEKLAQPYLIEVNGGLTPVGFEVCEDLWCQDYRKDGRALNITRSLVHNGAELIVNISSSPWTYLKHDARDRRIRFLTEDMPESFVPFYYVNSVGPQNNGKNIVTFDGGTTVYNSNGEPALTSERFFAPDLLIADHSQISTLQVERKEFGKIEQKYHAIISGLRYLKDMLGWSEHPEFVVGLSGGIDSAVVVTLLTAALGKDAVWAVNMPSQYNSSSTRNVAKHIANQLGIEYLEVPIESLVNAHKPVFEKLDTQFDSPEWMRQLSDENIQAKIRGTSILSNIAGRYGRMFTNNGNKLEVALGYATLYGDVGGVIAPIADLTKAEVYDLARYLNRDIFKQEVIPESLFPNALFEFAEDAIAPSAELKHDQVDPIKFGYHCAMIEAFTSFKKINAVHMLNWFLEGTLEQNLGISADLIRRWGVDDAEVFVKDLNWFTGCIRKSVFKRIQAPPIIVTSTSAYGYDIRESQLPEISSGEHQALEQQVLARKNYWR